MTDESTEVVALKPVKRKPSRPRLFCVAVFGKSIGVRAKTAIPKLIVTNDTSIKFFKSKGSVDSRTESTSNESYGIPLVTKVHF